MARWNYNYPNYPYPLVSNVSAQYPVDLGAGSYVHHNYPHGHLISPNYGMWNVPTPMLSSLNMLPQKSSDDTSSVNVEPNLTESQKKYLQLSRQRVNDQQFLDRFMKSRTSVDPNKSSVKICEFRELAVEAQKLINHLVRFQNEPDKVRTMQDLDSLQPIRARLNVVMEQLDDPVAMEVVKGKLEKRKAKREWMKRRRERREKEDDEILARRKQLDERIDQQREAVRMEMLNEKKDRDTRKAADQILSEVRRKQNEAKRWIELIESLKELRQLRAASLQARHALYVTEEDNRRFTSVSEKATQLMNSQLTVYAEEEQTLKAMMTKDEPKKEDETRKQWSMYLRRRDKI